MPCLGQMEIKALCARVARHRAFRGCVLCVERGGYARIWGGVKVWVRERPNKTFCVLRVGVVYCGVARGAMRERVVL